MPHERGGRDLSGVARVIGLQRHIRHAQTAAELAERTAFDETGVAARKGDIEHGVGVKFLDERGVISNRRRFGVITARPMVR